MADQPNLSEQFKKLSEDVTMIRGNQGFGRKPHKGALAMLAEMGPTQVHHYDQTTGDATIETIHDVTAILDDNKRQRLSGHDGYTPSRDLRKVASIPLGTVERLYKMGINIMDDNDWPMIAALLDSNEWAAFRTAPGVISKKPHRKYIVEAKR